MGRLVIAPTLLILNENRVEHFKEFVKRGGFGPATHFTSVSIIRRVGSGDG
jgi:beta-galactosidase GanA